MKHLRLIFGFYHKSILSTIMVTTIMTLTLLIFSLTVGQYRYLTYTRDLFEGANLQNSVYFMPAFSLRDLASTVAGQPPKYDVTDKIRDMKGVDSVMTTAELTGSYQGHNLTVVMLDDATLQSFRPLVASGEWLDRSVSGSQSPPVCDAVVGNHYFNHAGVGDRLNVTIYDRNGQKHPLAVNIKGKLNFPSIIPEFDNGGTNVEADFFFNKGDVVVVRRTAALEEMLDGNYMVNVSPCCFVNFSPDATKMEKSDCLDFLNSRGRTSDYSRILKNTNAAVNEKFATTMPVPGFFLVISVISLMSVSVLYTYKKMNELAIDYLCGCSRRRGFLYIAAGVGFMSAAAVTINLLIIANRQFLSEHTPIQFGNAVFDGRSYLILLAYMAVTLLLSLPLPFYVFAKSSPIEAYRRIE